MFCLCLYLHILRPGVNCQGNVARDEASTMTMKERNKFVWGGGGGLEVAGWNLFLGNIGAFVWKQWRKPERKLVLISPVTGQDSNSVLHER
jgi:hypothetical protein